MMSYIQNDYQYQELFNKRHYPKDTKARVLPYYVINNTIYFLLCQENYKHEHVQGIYNILGGHRENNETIIECAIRELKEESLNTVKFDVNLLKKELILKKNKRFIIFLPIFQDITKIIPQFECNKSLMKKNEQNSSKLSHIFENSSNIECFYEIKELKWISDREIRSRKIYRSVQDIFKSIITPQNIQISFEHYMCHLKYLYKKELGQSPLTGNSYISTNNSMPYFYSASSFYIFRNPKPILRQEYLTSTTQSYST